MAGTPNIPVLMLTPPVSIATRGRRRSTSWGGHHRFVLQNSYMELISQTEEVANLPGVIDALKLPIESAVNEIWERDKFFSRTFILTYFTNYELISTTFRANNGWRWRWPPMRCLVRWTLVSAALPLCIAWMGTSPVVQSPTVPVCSTNLPWKENFLIRQKFIKKKK